VSKTAVTYETLFEIAGKVNSSFTAGFQSAVSTVDNLDKKVKDLQTIQTKVTRFEGLNQELLNTQQNFEQTREKVKQLGTELFKSDRTLANLDHQFKASKAEVERLAAEIEKAKQPTAEIQRAFNAAEAEVTRLGIQLDKLNEPLQEMISAQRVAKAEVARLSAEIKESSQPTDEMRQAHKAAKAEVARLTAEIKKAKQPVAETKEAFNDAFKMAKAEVARLTAEIKKSTQPTEELQLAFNAATAEASRLEKELRQAESATNKTREQFEKASLNADNMQKKLESAKTALQQLGGELNDAGISTRNLAEDSANLTRQIERAEQAQKSYARAAERTEKISDFRDSMRNSLFDSAQAAAGIVVPVMAAVDFESSMADVKKVVDFDTPQQFKEMNSDVLDLSKDIPIAASGISDIVAAAGQAGIARKELVGFAEDAAKMGVSFDTTAEDSGKMMASWRIGFKMNQKEVVALADKINYLGNTAGAKADLISQVVTKIGPLGDVAGVASGEIAAMGATLLSVGVQEDIASTGIKNLMLGLTAGSAATKSQQQVFASLGMDAEVMAKKMQKNAKGAIIEVLSAIQRLPKAQQAAALTDLFGKESVGAIAPLLTGLDKLKTNFNRVADKSQYAGSMQKEFEARSATTANNLQLFKNNVNVLGITLGSVLLPPLNIAVKKLGAIADKVADFAEKHPTLTKVLVISTAATLGSVLAFSALGYVVSTVILPFARFASWAQKVELASKLCAAGSKGLAAAQWVLNAALTANPIGLIVVGIAALVAGFVIAYKHSETFRNAADKLWYSIKVGGAAAINTFISLLNKIPGVHITKVGVAPLPKAAGNKKIGHNATGTANWGGGLTWVNERGPELIDLPRGSRITPANKIANRGGINITYAPHITVEGGGSDIEGQVESGLRTGLKEFKKWFEDLKHEEARLSFE